MTNTKLDLLRDGLHKLEVNGFLVPRADSWPGEFVSEYAERLSWLSGFTGSAGIGIILNDKAAVLTDGRYTIQVKQEIDSMYWDSADIMKISIGEWLAEYAEEGSKIGYDPFLHSRAQIEDIKRKVQDKDIELVPLSVNPIDSIWVDGRPLFPMEHVSIFPESLAGKATAEKQRELAKEIKDLNGSGYFFATPDSIAWLLNIRGNDVPETPVPLSYALLKDDASLVWFIHSEKITDNITDHIGQNVSIQPFDTIQDELRRCSDLIFMDEQRTPIKFIQMIEEIGGNYAHKEDLVLWKKACKTSAEKEAVREAHRVDAVALKALHEWIKSLSDDTNLDELSIEQKLYELRSARNSFQGNSFSPIVGFNENGAVIHYRATEKTNKTITGQGLLLIDSGGQYMCDAYAGTTDITRTFAIGTPTEEQKFHYTLVLKAHIAVSMAIFPYGTTGIQIDTLARHILWQHGLDFAHGLGHGVGCFLNVHEEAASLSIRGNKVLEPGMLLSNEPGLYFEGKYGIRIENLMFVQKTGNVDNLGRDLLSFETVTFVPYDTDLIDQSLLNDVERKWLEEYNLAVSNIV